VKIELIDRLVILVSKISKVKDLAVLCFTPALFELGITICCINVYSLYQGWAPFLSRATYIFFNGLRAAIIFLKKIYHRKLIQNK